LATKKQRRRRDKDRRHEYEYVFVDDEGREVEVDGEEAEQPAKAEKKPAGKAQAPARGGRQVQPPSWQRVFKRAGLFAPLMLVVIYVLQGSKHNIPAAFLQTVILLAIFLPFSYFMDSLLWRSYQKRTGAASSQKRPQGRK
jgi:TRAP-type uncharacterized transport system fused permease subunit